MLFYWIFFRDAIRPIKIPPRHASESRNMPSRVGEHRLRNPLVRTTSPTSAENKRICRQRIGMQTKINRCYVSQSLASRIYSSDYSIYVEVARSIAVIINSKWQSFLFEWHVQCKEAPSLNSLNETLIINNFPLT